MKLIPFKVILCVLPNNGGIFYWCGYHFLTATISPHVDKLVLKLFRLPDKP